VDGARQEDTTDATDDSCSTWHDARNISKKDRSYTGRGGSDTIHSSPIPSVVSFLEVFVDDLSELSEGCMEASQLCDLL